ncbi:uncharacterized protein [Palaemon carinicauda]|uniref:uncharacterized protein n=1 Tax=Palaemon carinicauda TaxID=392227 RepID=UPI0035B5BE86
MAEGGGRHFELTNPFDSPSVALTCGICQSAFDSGHRRPIILPRCGHTFCRICIKELSARGDIMCPFCRVKYPNTDVDDLPINFNIQCLAGSAEVFDFSAPPKNVAKEGTNCPEHSLRLTFWCSSCEVAACGECLFEEHPKPLHEICRLQEVVHKVKEKAEILSMESSTEVVKRLTEALMRSLLDISDLQEAAYLLHETARLNRNASAAKDLASITSVFEKAKEIRERVADLNHNQTEQCQRPPKMTVIATRPAIMALSDNGCLAKVLVEKMGVHVYALQSASTAYSVAIKMSILTSCLSKENPVAFLDIKAGERKLGRVYITLDGRMRRAQQFIALCLGTLGPSYRGTRFDGVSEKDRPGEYIRGGDYKGKGGMGGEALMDNLEWGGSWSKPKKAGQVCGIGGELERKFGSLFAICLRDDTEDSFRSPFGQVTKGLDVLEVATRHKPFDVVHISECGILIEFASEELQL